MRVVMGLNFLVNGVTLRPGEAASADELRRAGLSPVSPLQRLVRRLPGRYDYWEADDPHVECFDGEVSIYPCRHGYLDRDRRWGTSCLVRTQGHDLAGIEVRVLDGVYAAVNLYDRFTDAVREMLGSPHDEAKGTALWQGNGLRVSARYQPDSHNAIFAVDLA